MTEQNTILWIQLLSTGMELYQDIFKKCLSLHSTGIAQDQIQNKYRKKKYMFFRARNMVKI